MNSLVRDALEWLDQMYEDLSKDPRYYGVYPEVSGDEVRYMEGQIRLYQGERLAAIKRALGRWLDTQDREKLATALWLIQDLGATEHAPKVKRLLDQIRASPSLWEPYWPELVESVLTSLRETDTTETVGEDRD